jgi:predicted MFS family arabinose efflux permease
MVQAIASGSTALLLAVLAIVVAGFACMQPSLNGMLSRRSDPQRQGAILGVGQSVSALARIVGSGLGIPLLARRIDLPFTMAAALMGVGLLVIIIASRSGRDFAVAE